jgi:uncharacterized protein YpiB (UPF0302 family)
MKTVKKTMIRWLARRLPTCREAAPLMSRAQDARLNWREQIALKLHLAICRMCANYLRQLEFLREAAHLAGQPTEENEPSPARLSDEARARLQEKMAAARR